MNLKLLFVEDDKDAITTVIDYIEKRDQNACSKVTGFEGARNMIQSFHPDIVILDLLGGSSDTDSSQRPSGLETRDYIWDVYFCPIVIYSAQPDIHDSEYDEHPFIKTIQKGRSSPQMVMDAVEKFRPQVDSIKAVEGEIKFSLSRALRDVAPYAFGAYSENEKTDRDNKAIG